jgi:tungstate transport system permease protein
MVLGQFFLASPIITAFVFSVVEGADKRIMKTALSLGATYFQAALTLISEVRCGIMAALIAGFGRVFGEIGVSMMLGGNIKNYTRNITTTIALETAKGEFALGIALGIILLVVAFVLSIGVYLLREKVA